jgi:hypothetical protein
MRVFYLIIFVLIYFSAASQPEKVDTDILWDSEKKINFQFDDFGYSDTLKVDKYLEAVSFCDTAVYERYMYLRNDEPFTYEHRDTTITWTFFDIANDIHFHDFDGDGKEDIFINYFHWGMGVMNNGFYFKNESSYSCISLPVGKIIMAKFISNTVYSLAIIVPRLHVEIIEVDFEKRSFKTVKEILSREDYKAFIK